MGCSSNSSRRWGLILRVIKEKYNGIRFDLGGIIEELVVVVFVVVVVVVEVVSGM